MCMCTYIQVLAARSIGIPARLAGCSQSITDDDHHWAEFWDADTTNAGPFGDNWHTREGTSKGNLHKFNQNCIYYNTRVVSLAFLLVKLKFTFS